MEKQPLSPVSSNCPSTRYIGVLLLWHSDTSEGTHAICMSSPRLGGPFDWMNPARRGLRLISVATWSSLTATIFFYLNNKSFNVTYGMGTLKMKCDPGIVHIIGAAHTLLYNINASVHIHAYHHHLLRWVVNSPPPYSSFHILNHLALLRSYMDKLVQNNTHVDAVNTHRHANTTSTCVVAQNDHESTVAVQSELN